MRLFMFSPLLYAKTAGFYDNVVIPLRQHIKEG